MKSSLLFSFFIILFSCNKSPKNKFFDHSIEFNFNNIKTKQEFTISKTSYRGSFKYLGDSIHVLQDFNTATIIYVNHFTQQVVKEFQLPRPSGTKRTSNLYVIKPDSFLYTDPYNFRLVLTTDKKIVSMWHTSDFKNVPPYLTFVLATTDILPYEDSYLLGMVVHYGTEDNVDSLFEHTPSQWILKIVDNKAELIPTQIKTVTSRNNGKDVDMYDYPPRIMPNCNGSFMLLQQTCDSVFIYDNPMSSERHAYRVQGSSYEVVPKRHPKNLDYNTLWDKVYNQVVLNTFAKSCKKNLYYRLIRPKNADFEKREPAYMVLETLDENFKVLSAEKISPNYTIIHVINNIPHLIYASDKKNLLRIEFIE